MLISAVGSSYDLFVNKSKQNNSLASVPYIKNTNSVDNVSFTGLKPEIIKNQFKILVSQDPWATKLAIKMPESDLEKEALLEFLEQRAKLDRYARLNNEKWEISIKLAEAERLSQTAPESAEFAEVMKWLQNRGNLDAVVDTLNKQIEQEAKRNRPAIEFFENLRKLEDEYSEKKLVKTSHLEKFWHKVKKGNINADGQYSTRELIEIVKSGKAPVKAEEVVATAPRITSKKELLAVLRSEYRQLLREETNVYDLNKDHTIDAKAAQRRLQEKYASKIKLFEVPQNRLEDIYRYVEREFNAQIDSIMDIDIYHLGDHWNQMSMVESGLRKLRQEASYLRLRLSSFPNDAVAQTSLEKKLAQIEEAKKLWIIGMKKSIKYEGINRQIMEDAGKLKQYNHLMGENKVIKLHKEALNVYEENDGNLPEAMWVRILS